VTTPEFGFDRLSSSTVAASFEQFIKERRYLSNVSPATIRWHEQTAKAVIPLLPESVGHLSDPALKKMVLVLAQGGHSPSGINCKLRSFNALRSMALRERYIPARLKIPKLRVEDRLTPSLTQGRPTYKGFCSFGRQARISGARSHSRSLSSIQV